MKVKYECDKGIMKFHFIFEQDDEISYQIQRNSYKSLLQVKVWRNSCEIHLPENWNLDSTHPDLLGLAAISLIFPFIGSKITLPKGVSSQFHSTFKKITGKDILPVDKNLNPRKAKSNYVPALAFSGGVDSTAASILLPQDSHLLYINRITPKEIQNYNSLLNEEAAFFACDSMRKLGKNVHIITTDLQFLRYPAGFHTFLSDSVPSILLADYYGYDSIANGHTIEEGYRVGYEGYKEAKEGSMIKLWAEILKVVDMPYSLPTIGLSEVCTSKIVMNSPYASFTQACSRGKINDPCMNCYKCFRKTLLEKILKNEPIDDQLLDRLFNIKDAQLVLRVSPIHFENVLTYICSKYNGSHSTMNLLKKKVRGDFLDTSWMEKWNPSSFEFIAPKYQEQIKKEILKNVRTMTKQDQENMKNFNYNHLTNSSDFESYNEELIQSFSQLNSNN